MGVRWDDVDLDANVIRVQRGWDDVVGEIGTKSRSGRRRVPSAKVLREYRLAHRCALVAGTGSCSVAIPTGRSTPPPLANEPQTHGRGRTLVDEGSGTEGLPEPEALVPIELHA